MTKRLKHQYIMFKDDPEFLETIDNTYFNAYTSTVLNLTSPTLQKNNMSLKRNRAEVLYLCSVTSFLGRVGGHFRARKRQLETM